MIFVMRIFENQLKNQVPLKSDNNNGSLHEDQKILFIKSQSVLFKLKAFHIKS
jgi:hypothetical protein